MSMAVSSSAKCDRMRFPSETIACQLDDGGLLRLQLNRPEQPECFHGAHV